MGEKRGREKTRGKGGRKKGGEREQKGEGTNYSIKEIDNYKLKGIKISD